MYVYYLGAVALELRSRHPQPRVHPAPLPAAAAPAGLVLVALVHGNSANEPIRISIRLPLQAG